MFFDMKKYLYSENSFNTLYIGIRQNVKKFLSDKINFASSNSSHFTFNSRFLYELKLKVRHSKTMCGIFHFLFSFKVYIFVQQKALTLKTLKHHNHFQN